MSEPDEKLIASLRQLLAKAEEGILCGFVAACFQFDGGLHVAAAGEQSLVTRLGALEVAKDALKILAQQQEQQMNLQQTQQWGNA